MSNSNRVLDAELMLPSCAAVDLDRHDCMRLAIRRAFPLPSTGAFTDVLAAITLARPTLQGGLGPNTDLKAIHFGGTVNAIFTIHD